MKTQLLLSLLSFFYVTANAQYNHGVVTFLEPDIFQITYPQQFIQVNFKKSQIPYAKNLFTSTDLDREEQHAIVRILKNQIDVLPSEFINEYLDVSIYPFHIYEDNVFGYFYENKIVIEAEKIMPRQSFRQSICHAFLRELAYLIHEKENEDNEIKSFIAYLNQFHSEHRQITGEDETELYTNGYVSYPLTGGYLASEEYVALFSHLMYPDTRESLINFLTMNQESILTDKINRFVAHLQETIPSLSRSYFFGEQIEIDSPPAEIEIAQNGEQLLNMHEMKSNETYDFSSGSSHEDYSSFSASNDANFEIEESPNYYEDAYQPDPNEEQIETLFDGNNDSTKDKKKKKKKRRKDGTGLLIVGSLLYLTLELLSQ